MLIQFALIMLPVLSGEQYQIFDGQYYNNLYYPRVDIIEWGKPLHLEFHVYQKDKPIDVSGQVIERGGQKIFSFAYDLKYRGERRCRAVPAPPHWQVGQKLLFYSDKSDKDMNRIIVSAEPMKQTQYAAQVFNGCEEIAAHSSKQPDPLAKQKAPASASPPTANDLDPTKDSNPTKDSEKEPPKKSEFGNDLEGEKNYNWFSN